MLWHEGRPTKSERLILTRQIVRRRSAATGEELSMEGGTCKANGGLQVYINGNKVSEKDCDDCKTVDSDGCLAKCFLAVF